MPQVYFCVHFPRHMAVHAPSLVCAPRYLYYLTGSTDQQHNDHAHACTPQAAGTNDAAPASPAPPALMLPLDAAASTTGPRPLSATASSAPAPAADAAAAARLPATMEAAGDSAPRPEGVAVDSGDPPPRREDVTAHAADLRRSPAQGGVADGQLNGHRTTSQPLAHGEEQGEDAGQPAAPERAQPKDGEAVVDEAVGAADTNDPEATHSDEV